MISLQPGRFHFGTRKSNVLAGNAPEPLATRTIDHLWHRFVEAPCVALVMTLLIPIWCWALTISALTH
jgi:hypothetical protein